MRQHPRELGVRIGTYEVGPLNQITDVPGVLVGHVTLTEGARTRTGVTAILPQSGLQSGNVFQNKLPAGLSVLNGFGKFSGVTQVQELGEIETPILLTNTLAVGRAMQALVDWTVEQPGNAFVTSVNAVVGETNDSRLNDIRAHRPTRDEMRQALEIAKPGAFDEGGVGAGTGTVAFGLKGGIGSASRLIEIAGETYVLGVLVQSNYGGALRIDGAAYASPDQEDKDGSIVMILATDAPLDPRNLERLATRAHGGLARTGAALSNGSGDYALAFSTHPDVVRTPEKRAKPTAYPTLGNDLVSPLFEAAIEATEEAILVSLALAKPTHGYNAGQDASSFFDALTLRPKAPK